MGVYEQALAKCDWSEKHIDKLKTVVAEFRRSNPCTISKKADSETGDVTYYVADVPVIPDEIALIAGDVLHNLRCALDYVACGLVGAENVTSKTKFPIRRDPKDWEVSGLRMVDGARKEAIEALRRIRPYEGGKTLLYVIHALNNVDKHRLLLTVNFKNTGRVTAESGEIGDDFLDTKWSFVHASGVVTNVGTTTSLPRVPLYAGQKLLTVPASQKEQDVGFLIDIAFGESGAAKGMPIAITLELASKTVRRVILELAPFL